MSVLLGLSWSFGFLAMISSHPIYVQVFEIIHTLLTSIQVRWSVTTKLRIFSAPGINYTFHVINYTFHVISK